MKITIRGLHNGTYKVRFFGTWSGEFLEGQQAKCRTGEITITVPQWAQAGDSDTTPPDRDIAFLLKAVADADRG